MKKSFGFNLTVAITGIAGLVFLGLAIGSWFKGEHMASIAATAISFVCGYYINDSQKETPKS